MSVNISIFISLSILMIYVLLFLMKMKKLPSLSNIMSLIIASMSLYTSILLFLDLISINKSLGDYEEYKLIVFLGSVAMAWVSLQTILEKFLSIFKKSGVDIEIV
ncbi:hypothetical protein [Arcobacter sp. F2176]|uniref:hypothetical protein n=1 Tax=Arcobacter sp. F2176 TaxID=2044511 RepID=UPI00100AD1FD|nr:hypothetical protein [Arcobacter sp. F2176]RXJ81066.1 hypothetical protein CRU95_09115 [Arcobacter sp. F2176]